MKTTFFYAALGERLTTYSIDVEGASLSRGTSVSLPARVQYIWPHPGKPLLYVVSSNGGPGSSGNKHHASALRIHKNSGELTAVGEPEPLPLRPIHCTVDRSGEHLLVAYNTPSRLTVHALQADGRIGQCIEQAGAVDFDVYSHQVMVTPSNRTVLMPARGNDDTADSPADTGCIKVYNFENGQLSPHSSVSPFPGFGPRHLDFHPNNQWVYLSVERQNQLHTYALENGESLADGPVFSCSSLARERAPDVRQIGCAIHVHPNGKFVYQSNRSDGFYERNGWRLGHRGEDSLAVYEINEQTGEPTPIQHVDVPSMHVRTFSIDPSGKLLVAATIQPVSVGTDTQGIEVVPAALMLYRIGEDGRLSHARTYEINDRGKIMFWTGMVTPAG